MGQGRETQSFTWPATPQTLVVQVNWRPVLSPHWFAGFRPSVHIARSPRRHCLVRCRWFVVSTLHQVSLQQKPRRFWQFGRLSMTQTLANFERVQHEISPVTSNKQRLWRWLLRTAELFMGVLAEMVLVSNLIVKPPSLQEYTYSTNCFHRKWCLMQQDPLTSPLPYSPISLESV